MKYKLILVDDDDFTLKIEKDYLNQAILDNNFSFEIAGCMRNYSELTNFLDNNQGDYIYFMDLDFGENQFNGIDISNKIRKLQPSAKIIFVTSHPEEVFSILKSGVAPFGFIEKSIQPGKMQADFAHYLKLIAQDSKPPTPSSGTQPEPNSSISIPIGIDEYIDLPFDKIAYIETASDKAHHLYFHTIDQSKLIIRYTLADILQKLPSYFVRAHRSTIVNKKLIVTLQKNQLRLSNGTLIPVSRKYLKSFKKDKS